MKSYGQFCAMAKALDSIGDRWSLLIVRELMLLGACRYTDLLNGLPGIATNLLAERLRHLEGAGVISREAAPPPVATTLFRLTARGEALLPVIRELGRWGAPLLGEAGEDDAFRSYWMTLPLELYYYDTAPDQPPVVIEVHVDEQPLVIETVEGKIRAHRGSAVDPDVVLTGPPRLVIGALSGRINLNDALHEGLKLEGDARVLGRIRSGLAPAQATV